MLLGVGAELAGGVDSSAATVRLVASSADLAAARLASHGRTPLSIAQTKRWSGMYAPHLLQLVRYAWSSTSDTEPTTSPTTSPTT